MANASLRRAHMHIQAMYFSLGGKQQQQLSILIASEKHISTLAQTAEHYTASWCRLLPSVLNGLLFAILFAVVAS